MFGIWSSLMWWKKQKSRTAFPPLPASLSPSSWSLAGGAGCSPLSGVSAQTLLQPYSSGWGERPRSPCTAQCYLRLAFRWGYLSPPHALQGWPSACTHTQTQQQWYNSHKYHTFSYFHRLQVSPAESTGRRECWLHETNSTAFLFCYSAYSISKECFFHNEYKMPARCITLNSSVVHQQWIFHFRGICIDDLWESTFIFRVNLLGLRSYEPLLIISKKVPQCTSSLLLVCEV